jgi:hypothetical protein
VILWRTYAVRAKGSFKKYHPTEVNVTLYEEVQKYIAVTYGHKLIREKIARPQRKKGFETAKDLLEFLEKEENSNATES